MKRKIKSKKQLDRERELEREQRKQEFEKQYYKEKEEWGKYGFDSWVQFDSLEEYLEKKLKNWEGQQLKIPTGKYRDTEKIVSTYQQKFVEYTRQLCPQVIEELRKFVPNFERLFGEQKDRYIDIFDTYKMEIFDLDSSLDGKISYLIIKDNFLRFRPNKHSDYRYDYVWGEHRLLFHFLYLLFVRKEANDKTNEVLQDTIQLLRDNLIIERDYIKPPDDFDEERLQNYVLNESSRIIIEILSNDEQNYFRDGAKPGLTKFLQGISATPETSIVDFIELQIGLLNWAERHNLQKDWLLRYAYFFLFQFSDNPNLKLDEVEIPFLNVRSLHAYPFEFRFNGWLAGDEEREEYEKRLTESFESELQRYFHNISSHFDLDKKQGVTKPVHYDRVKWLVRWTVQGWSKEQVRVEVEQEFQNQGIEKYIDISTIDKAFRQFKEFDLPIRD